MGNHVFYMVKKSNGKQNVLLCFSCGEKVLLVSYVVKKSSGIRNLLVLSTMHNDAKVTKDARKKPHVIAFYDNEKRSSCDGHDCWIFYYKIQDKALDSEHFSVQFGNCLNKCSQNLQRHSS